MKRVLLRTLFGSIVLCLLISIAGCAKAPEVLDSGADHFAEGKKEEDYSLRRTGTDISEMLDNFSGSFFVPTGSEMSEDEYEDLRKQIDEDNGVLPEDESTEEGEETAETTPTPIALPQVRNLDDLIDAVFQAYDELAPYVEVQAASGYIPDLSRDMQYIVCQIERRDSIVGTGVEAWYWHITDSGQVTISFTYSFDTSELARMRNEARLCARDEASRLRLAGGTEYELVAAVNQFLCDTVYYPPNEPYAPVTHSAYGALVDGCAVCEGYSCAAQAILRELGIDCDMVFGDCINGGAHAWNLVAVNGSWYQLDVTWNDGASTNEYFLTTDDYMRQSRSWDTSLYPATPSSPCTP